MFYFLLRLCAITGLSLWLPPCYCSLYLTVHARLATVLLGFMRHVALRFSIRQHRQPVLLLGTLTAALLTSTCWVRPREEMFWRMRLVKGGVTSAKRLLIVEAQMNCFKNSEATTRPAAM
jgi:hypothetical protein